MRPLIDMDTIQVEITNACVHECANCTRLVGHSEKPFFMSLDDFRAAVDSLVDFPKMVGVMGGEPLIHPHFEEMADYLHSRIPRERCGLWSTLPRGKEFLAPLIAKVFGNVLLNDHTHGDIMHSPVLVSPEDLGLDEFTMWYRIDHCPVQNSWSASITPKGGFFCEVAGALDMVLQGPGGWEVRADWWKRTPRDYAAQMERYCRICGAAMPLKARKDTDGIDDLSESMVKRLVNCNSPKVRKGKYALYNQGFVQEDARINQFRRDNDYFKRIAARYGLGLRTNNIGYLEPFLLPEKPSESKPGNDPQPQQGLAGLRATADAAMGNGDYAEAADLYAACLAQDPLNVSLLYDYGCALNNLKRYKEAAASFCRALAHEPDNIECTLMLAFAYQHQNRQIDALHYYRLLERRGVINQLRGLGATVYFLAGRAALESGQIGQGRDFLEKSLRVDPESIPARFLRCMSGINMPATEAEAEEMRSRFAIELDELIRLTRLDTAERIEKAYSALGEAVHYYLAYLGENDRSLQAKFGGYICSVMAAQFPSEANSARIGRQNPDVKIKIGFVSAHFYTHSVWKIITRGWLAQLNRDKFALNCYFTGEIHDPATEDARNLADLFFESHDVSELIRRLSDDRLDVIIYPGIGMDHRTQQLAALRLAPVQCVAWGHPETTGMPTIDYFLSSELMEPENAREHYTEQLVLLPNLSVCYEPLPLPAGGAEPVIETTPDDVLFLCCQNLLKYHPQYDEVFARIAREVPTARFIFIDYAPWHTKILAGRLQGTFQSYGMTASAHITFLPKLNSLAYSALNGQIDIYLDSIGWSGGNTTLESLPYNKPIVTLPGKLMRGRHTFAMLKMMDVTETIATDLDDYVRIAIRLASDTEWRRTVSARMAANKHKLYNDNACIDSLEGFLEGACSIHLQEGGA